MRGNRVSSIKMPTLAPYSALPPQAIRLLPSPASPWTAIRGSAASSAVRERGDPAPRAGWVRGLLRDTSGISRNPLADRRLCFVQRLADDVDKGRLTGLGGVLQCCAQLRRVFYAPALDAVSSGDSGVIGAGEIDR